MKKRTAPPAKRASGAVAPAAVAETSAVPPATEGLFDRVAAILDQARTGVVRAVNSHMVIAYWLIGREIVQELQSGQDRAEYGEGLIADLSSRLTERCGEGFSVTSLKYFRTFYVAFPDRLHPKGHPLGDLAGTEPGIGRPPGDLSANTAVRYTPGGESPVPPFHPSLSWSHYRALMRVERPAAREFYECEAVAAGWSKRELERQIHSFYYERLLASSDRKGMLLEQRQATARLDPVGVLKSSTVLEFLGLPDTPRLHESELEQAIMDNLQTFLLEMGRGFSFVARQRRLAFEDDEFYVDLVFYNFLLKCFVLIDLKIGKLTHQDVGQMDSYVRLYEDLYKVPGDNPTVGIILCSEKNETVARYSVLQENRQLFASKYRLHLPTEDELAAELSREIRAIEEGRRG